MLQPFAVRFYYCPCATGFITILRSNAKQAYPYFASCSRGDLVRFGNSYLLRWL
jgi:hypothetical protein